MGEIKKTVKHRPRKGAAFRHIIKTVVKDGREYQLHATKGWRSRRA